MYKGIELKMQIFSDISTSHKDPLMIKIKKIKIMKNKKKIDIKY